MVCGAAHPSSRGSFANCPAMTKVASLPAFHEWDAALDENGCIRAVARHGTAGRPCLTARAGFPPKAGHCLVS